MPAKKSPSKRASSRRKKGAWIASTAVVISDLGRAKSWYTEKLGLDVLADGDHWVVVGRPGKGGGLHLCQPSDPKAMPLEPGNSGILFLAPGEVKETYADLKAKGVEFVGEPEERPWGWDVTFKDPDGNEFLLMEADD